MKAKKARKPTARDIAEVKEAVRRFRRAIIEGRTVTKEELLRLARATTRTSNPETGPSGGEIPTQSEVGAFIEELDRITLYAVPIGKVRVGVNAWEAGQVFQAVNPPRWTGSPFFRSSDAERIYDLGYRKIIVMGGAGETFDVDLVMQ